MKKTLHSLTIAVLLVGLQAHAAPTFENAATAQGESSTISIPAPAGTQAGDLLVAALMLDKGKLIDVTAPSGWTLVRRSNKWKYIGMAIYQRIANTPEPSSFQFPLDETTKWSASISRISSVDPDNPIDISNRATGRSGNVKAPSMKTRSDDTLVLAFYTNRRDATYTPDSSTAEQYDKPNTAAELPSNMLATFEKPTIGYTGSKYATPTRNDRHWIGMQVAIKAGEAAEDLFGFSIATTSNPTAGDTVTLQITAAQDAEGTPLNGTVEAAIISNLDGPVFDEDVVFADGNATLSITLITAGTHVLTAGLAGINETESLTVPVNRRPITLTADSGQSKMQNDPDPELTFALTSGSLLTGVPLSGEPARDAGEEVGLYTIEQGSLTDANNPSYAITFVSADFEIVAPEEEEEPLLIEKGIWTSAEEIADLPMVGDPWRLLKYDADRDYGIPNISDQEDRANVYAMSKALVYVRTGIESYRTEVIDACMQAIDTENGGRSLALGRNLGAFIIAADLVGLPPAEDALFRDWLHSLLTEKMSDNRSLVDCHEQRPNNWGTHAGGSRAALAAYLEDWDELGRVAQVFKGYLGDRTSYANFIYGDLDWQADASRPVGVNPAGAMIQGHNVDGVPPDDQRRSGDFTWPPPKEGYVYEAMQGALLQAVILHRAGYDVWNWEDRALLRIFTWLHNVADYPSTGDDTWEAFIINYFYGTDFPTPTASWSGKNVSRACWTHP